MLVRAAEGPDAARIAEIHVRTWQAAYRGIVPDSYLDALSAPEREKNWREILARVDRYVLVAEKDGVVAGWLSGGKSRDRDASATTAEIYAIYVEPDYWRRGAGRALWRHAERHFRSLTCEKVTLWVFDENGPARRFYEALGFCLDAGGQKSIERGGKILAETRYGIQLGALLIPANSGGH